MMEKDESKLYSVWLHFVECLPKDQCQILLELVDSLSSENKEEYFKDICNIPCVRKSDNKIAKRIWKLTKKKYRSKAFPKAIFHEKSTKSEGKN